MKILFVDSSGDDGWPEPYGNSKKKKYVTLGFAIDAKKWLSTALSLNLVMEKAFEEYEIRPKEFHYTDLVAGKQEYCQLSGKEKKNLADKVFKIIIDLEPTLFAIVVKKKQHYEKYQREDTKGKQVNTALNPSILGVAYLFSRFDKYLSRIGDIGCIVIDSQEYRQNEIIQAWAVKVLEDGGIQNHEDLSTPTKRRGLFFKGTRYLNIVETCFFTKSEYSPGIQLSDACCYATYAKYEHRRSKRFKEIEHLFDSAPPEYPKVGILIWPPK